MSEIYVVWAEDADAVQARMNVIADGERYRVLRRGEFPLIQAEDIDRNKSLDSHDARYCIIFEIM